MSDMKCPICGNVLEQSDEFPELFMCLNCQINMKHNQWQELIKLMETKDLSDKIGKLETELERTRKALDVAVDALKSIDWCGQDYANAQGALEEITALEQKDVK